MSFLFLDIDGVLNNAAPPTGGPEDMLGSVDAACVAQLNRITDATGAHIIVCSTWRLRVLSGRETFRAIAILETRNV